jgi:anthranilate synthase component 1
MVRPDRDHFRALAARGLSVPLVREVLADLDTPLAIFRKLDDGETAFLFESVEANEKWGRYSFIGIGARARLVARPGEIAITRAGERRVTAIPGDHRRDPLDSLRPLLAEERLVDLPGLPPFAGGAVGYLAYDWVRYVERLPDDNPDALGVPDCFFTFPETVLVHDRLRQTLSVIHPVRPADVADAVDADAAYARGVLEIERVLARLAQPLPPEAEPKPNDAPLVATASATRESYREMVERAREYIRAGDIFQVVPSYRVTLPLCADPFQIYRQLRAINPSPYMFFLRCDDHVVLGSSPEVLVRLERGEITLRPIAGTHPRGATEAEDQAIEAALRSDPKERAEHVMLVDLGRNDVGRVAEIGSVHVDEFESIERYSHVMHLVSNVRGRLRADKDAIDLLRATFPAGTLSGAPKVRAMEIIEELESSRRGLYGGAVGYIDPRGNMDTCIAIRTLLVKGGSVHAQAGGGVVADSDPDREYDETRHKLGAVLLAIERAGGGKLA